MDYIFNSLNNMNDEEARMMIGMLSCITFSNMVKEHGQKALRFFIGGNEEDFTGIKKAILEVAAQLEGTDRNELNERLRNEIIVKYNAIASRKVNSDVSNEMLSVCVIRETTQLYSIDRYKTPAQQMDEIREKYYEQYLLVLQKKMMKLNVAEKELLEIRIRNAMQHADINRLRQLAQELMLREFNGHTILMKIQSQPGVNALRKIVDVLGIEVFDTLDGAINTAYDSMLLINRVERILLAQVIWAAGRINVNKMTLNEDLMPSFTSILSQEDEEKERKVLTLIKKEKELNDDLSVLLKAIERENQSYAAKESRLEREQDNLNKLEEALLEGKKLRDQINTDGKQIKKAYEDYVRTHTSQDNNTPEFKIIKADYEELARKIRNCDSTISSLERQIQNTEDNIKKHNTQIGIINTNLKELREALVEKVAIVNDIIFKLEDEVAYIGRVLRKKWGNYFSVLTFENRVYEEVVRRFTQREIVAIERMLTEMEITEDPTIFEFAPGIIYCYVSNKKYAKIVFADWNIKEITLKDR